MERAANPEHPAGKGHDALRGGRKAREAEVLRAFVEVFCRARHAVPAEPLCPDCASLLDYALERLARCPMEPKPKCKDCPVHCYRPEMRARIREVMKHSGMHFVKRGRIDWLVKYFLM